MEQMGEHGSLHPEERPDGNGRGEEGSRPLQQVMQMINHIVHIKTKQTN